MRFSKEKDNDFEPTIVIKSVRFDDGVEVRIADNGPGFRKRTGLGVSISYDIITQMHNGKL